MVDRANTTSPYRAKQRLAVAGLMVVLGITGGVAVSVGGTGFPAVLALQKELLVRVREIVEVRPEPPPPFVDIALATRAFVAVPEPPEPPPPPRPPKIVQVEPPVAPAPPETPAAAEPAAEKPLVLSPALVPGLESGEGDRPAPVALPPPPAQPDPATPRAATTTAIPRSITDIFGWRPAAAPSLGPRRRAAAFRPRDVYGWNGIEWGSSSAILKKAFGRRLAAFESDATEYSRGFDVDHVARDVRFGTMSFDVLFQMSKDTKELRQVLVDSVDIPKHGDFAAVFARMEEIYGPAASYVNYLPRKAGVERPLSIYKKAIWKFPTTTIHLTVMAGPTYFRERKGWLYLRYFPTPKARSSEIP